MSRNVFGWDYPPGAENDPNAPWNQKDPPECVSCGDGLEAQSTKDCEKHAGPVCNACRCPECPPPTDTYPEPDEPDFEEDE